MWVKLRSNPGNVSKKSLFVGVFEVPVPCTNEDVQEGMWNVNKVSQDLDSNLSFAITSLL